MLLLRKTSKNRVMARLAPDTLRRTMWCVAPASSLIALKPDTDKPQRTGEEGSRETRLEGKANGTGLFRYSPKGWLLGVCRGFRTSSEMAMLELIVASGQRDEQ